MNLAITITSCNLIPVLLLATIATVATSNDHYLLSCGASVTVDKTNSTLGGLTWQTDDNSTFSDNFSSTTAVSTTITTNVENIPFATARVFTTNFTYSFPVSPGPKFIRFFFYPSPSTYLNSSTGLSLSAVDAYLTVEANSDHLLLSNFSAYLSLTNSSKLVVQKEFYVNVTNSPLQLTVSPSTPGSHAFINGIEVVSVPLNLYVNPTSTITNVAGDSTIQLLGNTALENVYRLTVGGTEVNTDSGSMYRRWESDDDYLIDGIRGTPGVGDINKITFRENFSAPAEVYVTYRELGKLPRSLYDKSKLNLTWGFEVDLGFYYLLRLHWCDVSVDINASSYLIFDVYIDQQMAEPKVDIFAWVGDDVAAFKDYAVYMDGGGDGTRSRGTLELALNPNLDGDPEYVDVMLNGLEIFKINQTDGSLNATNPKGPPNIPIDQTPSPTKKPPSHTIVIVIGAVTGAVLVAVLICCLLIFRRRKLLKTSGGSSGTNSTKSKLLFSFGKSTATTKRSSGGGGGGGSSLPSDLCRHFSLSEIRLATSDFIPSLIIGHGGFGNVYKGTVNTESGPTTVAIKRLNPLSGQGAREFTTEIELLSKLRHVHLVSLIGYCDDGGEMILVYEFMSRGTLREHLYPNITGQMMPWCQRLQACVGAARGLHYLHTGTERMIIHRDVKSTNILVDESWVAKVSDFGLSKLGPVGGELSHVSTHVKGSFGYVDPEYYRRQQLTEKSDVYSFGVVLFEVLCGRAAVNPNLPKEQVNLRIWARKNQLSGTLDTIVDPNLKGQIAPECLRKFGEVAESCVRDEGANRPSMVDVIWGLEFALQLQLESAAKTTVHGDYKTDTVYDENVATTDMGSPITDSSARLIKFSEENSNWSSINNSSSGLFSNTTLQGGDGGSTDVFSQIFKPEGR